MVKLRVLVLACVLVGTFGAGLMAATSAFALQQTWNIEEDPNAPGFKSGCITGATWVQIDEMNWRLSVRPHHNENGLTCWGYLGASMALRFADEAASMTGSNTPSPALAVVHPRVPADSGGGDGGCHASLGLEPVLPPVVAAVFGQLERPVEPVLFVHCRGPHGHGKGLEHFPDRRRRS